MSTPVVVDASLVLKWVLEERYTAEAFALLEEWQKRDVRPVAPGLLAFEVANALYKRLGRRELTIDVAKGRLDDLLTMGPDLEDDRSIHTRALDLAYGFGRPTAYDAHYLALAERQGCECWTGDERLWNAVKGRLGWVRWVGELRRADSNDA